MPFQPHPYTQTHTHIELNGYNWYFISNRTLSLSIAIYRIGGNISLVSIKLFKCSTHAIRFLFPLDKSIIHANEIRQFNTNSIPVNDEKFVSFSCVSSVVANAYICLPHEINNIECHWHSWIWLKSFLRFYSRFDFGRIVLLGPCNLVCVVGTHTWQMKWRNSVLRLFLSYLCFY